MANRNKPESGRSMVEMLGVLAVMGVLTVGGITGYKMAMTKWKVNELVNELNTRGHTYLGTLDRTGTLSADEFESTTRTGYPVELSLISEGSGEEEIKLPKIKLSGVEKKICQELINAGKSGWPVVKQMFVGDAPATESNCALASAQRFALVYNPKGYDAAGDRNVTTTTGYETTSIWNPWGEETTVTGTMTGTEMATTTTEVTTPMTTTMTTTETPTMTSTTNETTTTYDTTSTYADMTMTTTYDTTSTMSTSPYETSMSTTPYETTSTTDYETTTMYDTTTPMITTTTTTTTPMVTTTGYGPVEGEKSYLLSVTMKSTTTAPETTIGVR